MRDVRDSFKSWLTESGNAKKYAPLFCISCIEIVSKWAMRKNQSKISLWEIANIRELNAVRIKLSKDKIFKVSDGKNYKAFEKVGLLYATFLKEYLESFEEIGISKKTIAPEVYKSVENKAKEIRRERTIAEAIEDVLKQKQPLTISQIYQEIVAQGLYIFGAIHPESVVAITIKRQCQNYNYSRSDQHPNTFKLVGDQNGKQLFALLDYTSNVRTIDLAWNDEIRNSFFDWIIKQGKKEGTAKSYCSSMNWVIANYPNEWKDALNQGSTISGIEFFIETVSNKETFISANQTAHNQYSAALNAFTGYLKDFDDVKLDDDDELDTAFCSESRIYNWSQNEVLYKTKPQCIKYLDSNVSVEVRSWKNVLINVFEYIVNEFSNKDLLKCNDQYGGSRILCSYNERDLFSAVKLSNGLYIEANYSSNRIIKVCKMFLEFCGADLSRIEIEYRRKSKPIKIELTQKEAKMGIDYNATESQVTIVLETIKTNFQNGIRLDNIDIGKLKDILDNETDLVPVDDEDLKVILKDNLWDIDKVYYHQDSLLCGIDIEEIKSLLYNEFEKNYQRIYTCRLREYYGDKIAAVVSSQMLGKMVSWQTDGQIRHNEKSGFLSYYRYSDKNADAEIQKALLRVLKESAGLTKEEIAQELRFYSYDKIYWMLEKTEKVQQKHYSWEWKEMFKCGDRYYHVETIYFTELELQKIKEIAMNMREDKGLLEQAGIILQVAQYLLDNYKEVKMEDATKLIKIAEKIMPGDEIDVLSLLKTLLLDDVAGISGLVNDYGEAAVKKALEYYLSQKHEDHSVSEVDDDESFDDEVDDV